MKVVIPYIHHNTVELKYCLRGIEKYIDNPEIILIGDKPAWIQNVTNIFYKDNRDIRFRERNIFEKIMLAKDDFLFFNDDHFLLEPFSHTTYHFSGSISQRIEGYTENNSFRQTVQNTFDLYGDIDNYYRHAPIYCEREKLEPLKNLDWNKHWGYCSKSIYCHIWGIKGEDYPDLKIREQLSLDAIKNQVNDRPYFSTGNNAVNKSMVTFLQELYPGKSKYEI